MSVYLWLKLLHILSGTLILGTGLGIAFFMLKAYLSQNVEALKVTTQTVVTADWIFTTPAIVIQLISGFALVGQLGVPYGSAWFIGVICIFIFVGLCWIPVVFIQIRIKKIIRDRGKINECAGLMRIWALLGVPAFTGVLVLYYLMVSKSGMGTIIFA